MLMFFDSHLWTSLSEKVGQELSNYIIKLYQKFLMRLCYNSNYGRALFNKPSSDVQDPLHVLACLSI